MYSYVACDGCSYHVYDSDGVCIKEHVINGVTGEYVCGGGFAVDETVARIVFSANTKLSKTVNLTVADIINGVDTVTMLNMRLDDYSVHEQYRQAIINIYLDTTKLTDGDSLDVKGSISAGGDIEALGTVKAAGVEAADITVTGSASLTDVTADTVGATNVDAASVDATNIGADTVVTDSLVLGGKPFVPFEIVTVWVNASPTSTFPEQTIELDLSTFDEVEIIAYISTTSNDCVIRKCLVTEDGSGVQLAVDVNYTSDSSTQVTRLRKFTVSTTGVLCNKAWSKNAGSGGDTASSSSYIIPYEIRGIRRPAAT